MYRMIRALPMCALALATSGAFAQTETWPNRFLRWVIPFSAGSGQDTLARQVGPRLSEKLGQPVVIDNRAGAGGVIGFEYTAKAAPDGYQFMLGNNSLLILSAIRPTPYDPIKDFDPVMLMAYGYTVLAVHPSLPVNSVAELIAYSKANPGKLNYASPGVGTLSHLATELFMMQTGANFVHIPHKGIVAGTLGLVAGDVGFMITGADLAPPHVKSGKLKLLATAGQRRAPVFPDLPSTADLGFKDYNINLWYGLLVPAGTRREIVGRLNAEISRILLDPAFKEELLKRGIDPVTSTPSEFGSLMKSEFAGWQNVIKAGNIKPE